MLRPKVGDIYIAYSRVDGTMYWRMQVLLIVNDSGCNRIVCCKVGGPLSSEQLYLFDEDGREVSDTSTMDFYLYGKSRARSTIVIVAS